MELVQGETLHANGVFSIWLGDFDDEDALDEYMDDHFKHDFGFTYTMRFGPEADVEEEPADIRALLSGYSWFEHYGDAAVQAATNLGIHQATTAIVFRAFKYDPRYAKPDLHAPVRFIGAFPMAHPA